MLLLAESPPSDAALQVFSQWLAVLAWLIGIGVGLKHLVGKRTPSVDVDLQSLKQTVDGQAKSLADHKRRLDAGGDVFSEIKETLAGLKVAQTANSTKITDTQTTVHEIAKDVSGDIEALKHNIENRLNQVTQRIDHLLSTIHNGAMPGSRAKPH